MRHYPRWQVAVTDRLFSQSVVRGAELETSCRVQHRVCRLLGQPLSERSWARMTFNDKVLYRKLVVRDARLKVACDKLATRASVVARLGDDAVTRVLAVADSARDLAELRGPFVLKANHGSGMVILVDEDRTLTADECATADQWIGEDFARWSREWGYAGVRRALIAEERMASPSPPDYKFFVFDGRARAVQVDEHRFSDHRRSIMSMQWGLLGGCEVRPPDSPPARPDQFDEMTRIAEELAQGYDFLRVDLYNVGGRVLVGELTAYPIAGTGVFSPRSLDRELGAYWTTLPTEA